MTKNNYYYDITRHEIDLRKNNWKIIFLGKTFIID